MKVFWSKAPMFLKKLTVPFSNSTKQITVAQTWEVRWESRHSEYASGTQPEMEAFLTEAEARAFADSLQKAFKLIRHTSGTRVEVNKSKSR